MSLLNYSEFQGWSKGSGVPLPQFKSLPCGTQMQCQMVALCNVCARH